VPDKNALWRKFPAMRVVRKKVKSAQPKNPNPRKVLSVGETTHNSPVQCNIDYPEQELESVGCD
jgi:hypothetical protein